MPTFFDNNQPVDDITPYDYKKDAETQLKAIQYENGDELKTTKQWRENSRLAYRMMESKDFEGTDEELGQYGYNLVQGANWNLSGIMGESAGAIELYANVQSATPEEREALRRMRTDFENTGATVKDFGRALGYMAVDPLNYVGFGVAANVVKRGMMIGGAKIFGHKAADKVASKSLGAIPKMAISGANWGAADSVVNQNTDIDISKQDEFSYGEMGKSMLLGAGGALALGALAYPLVRLANRNKGVEAPVDAATEAKPTEADLKAEPTKEEIQRHADKNLDPNSAEGVRKLVEDNTNIVDEYELKAQERVLKLRDEYAKQEKLALTPSEKIKLEKALEEDVAYAIKQEQEAMAKTQDELFAYKQKEAQDLEAVLYGNKADEADNRQFAGLSDMMEARKKEVEDFKQRQEFDPTVRYADEVKPNEIPKPPADVEATPLDKFVQERVQSRLAPEPKFIKSNGSEEVINSIKDKVREPVYLKQLEDFIGDSEKPVLDKVINGTGRIGSKEARTLKEALDKIDDEATARIIEEDKQNVIESALEEWQIQDYRPSDAIKYSVADYAYQHSAPMREDMEGEGSLDSLAGIYGDEIYSKVGLDYYRTGAPNNPLDKKTFDILQEFKGKPDKEITIYRAVPLYAEKINPGDWVGITKQYAEQHGDGNLDGDYKILEKKVKASDIFTNGDSWHEWGYDPIDSGVMFQKGGNGTLGIEMGIPRGGEVTQIVSKLMDDLVEHGSKPYPIFEVPSPMPANQLQGFERVTGKRIVFVDGDSIPFNGVYNPRQTNTLFVNRNSQNPYKAVIGHEFTHSMIRNNPETYNELVNTLLPMMDTSIEELAKRHGNLGDSALMEEGLADMVGQAFQDKDFWNKLSDDNPTLFEKVLSMLYDFIDDFKIKYLGASTDAQPVAEMAQMQKDIESIVINYLDKVNPNE